MSFFEQSVCYALNVTLLTCSNIDLEMLFLPLSSSRSNRRKKNIMEKAKSKEKD